MVGDARKAFLQMPIEKQLLRDDVETIPAIGQLQEQLPVLK